MKLCRKHRRKDKDSKVAQNIKHTEYRKIWITEFSQATGFEKGTTRNTLM